MFRHLEREAQLLGMARPSVSCEESLVAGFRFGLCWLSEGLPSDEDGELDRFLKCLGTSVESLQAVGSWQDRKAWIRADLVQRGKYLSQWFDVGHCTFGATWGYSQRHDLTTQEQIRAAMVDDAEVRPLGSAFMDSLLKVDMKPDEVEHFFADKIIPMLHEPGLKKWAVSPHSPVLTDLRYLARVHDEKLGYIADPRASRVVASGRALLEAEPFIGRALAALIFGPGKR